MCFAHAGIDHVGMNAGVVVRMFEAAVERPRPLINPVETPRHAARRTQQRRQRDE